MEYRFFYFITRDQKYLQPLKPLTLSLDLSHPARPLLVPSPDFFKFATPRPDLVNFLHFAYPMFLGLGGGSIICIFLKLSLMSKCLKMYTINLLTRTKHRSPVGTFKLIYNPYRIHTYI